MQPAFLAALSFNTEWARERFRACIVTAKIASVQLSFDSATGKSHEWIDFHNLLRINGVWKITNKTATHSSR